MNFKRILYMGFGIVIMVMVIILTAVIFVLSVQNEKMNDLVKDRYEKIQIASQIRSNFNSIKNELDLLSLNSTDGVNGSIEESFHSINENLSELKNSINTEEGKYLINKIEQSFKEYRLTTESFILEHGSDSQMIADDLFNKLRIKQAQLVFDVEELIFLQERIMNDSLEESEDTYKTVVSYLTLVAILGVFIGAGAAYWVIINIKERLLKLAKVMGHLTYDSSVFPKIETVSNDEIGEIATAYNEMAIALEKHVQIEKEYQEEIEHQNWIKTKVAELSVLTQGNLELEKMGDLYIQRLSEFVGASHGAFYMKKNNGQADYLVLISGYAYGGRIEENEIKPSFSLGEGLIGQSAKDHKIIHAENIPENYIQITSSLGKASPNSIIVLPVEYEGEVIGVIELASLTPLNEQHLKLLEQATNHLGIAVNRISKHMQVQQLLEESQILNEELQTQSEELQLQQEELKTMNDELEAQYKHSEIKTKQLEQIKVELEEKTKEIMMSSNYKSEFLANMSHELRTPLNSLLILGQMLSENKEGNLSRTQVEYAKTIFSSGKDLLNLINDILDLSKIESGKMDVTEVEVELRDILSEILRQFDPIASKKGIDFTVTKHESVPGVLFSDDQKINQILKNLLSNAFKFTEKGKVQLDIGWKNVRGENGEFKRYIAFSVIDTGIGIPQDKVPLIFEAFKQADGTTSRRYGGTGLGLSICKELSGLLGGFIEVETMEGVGSTFTFYLPHEEQIIQEKDVITGKGTLEFLNRDRVRASSKNSSTLNAITSGTLSAKKILIVDDDMRNIFALTSALEAEGVDVVFAENGKEAVETIEHQKDVDLILMDIMMPEMDGYEAISIIRRMPDFSKLPIIALTAKAMKHDKQKCIDAGASDYISKPVDISQLKSLIQVWLHNTNDK